MNIRIYLLYPTGVIGEEVLEVNSILELNHKIKQINNEVKAFITVNEDDFTMLYKEVFNKEVYQNDVY